MRWAVVNHTLVGDMRRAMCSFTLAAPAAALTMRAEYIASMAVRDCARVSVREGTLACVKDTWKERKKVTYARTGDSVMS